jgi:hypothetical protein
MAMQPRNSIDLQRLFERAIARDAQGLHVDEEELVLLAEGRIDELSDARVLRAVAADPELAEVVAEARELFAAQPAGARGRESHRLMFATRAVFALAACVMLSLGLWRMIDPPAAPGGIGTASVSTQPATSDAWRETALIVSIVVAVLLAVPVAWWAIRSKPETSN